MKHLLFFIAFGTCFVQPCLSMEMDRKEMKADQEKKPEISLDFLRAILLIAEGKELEKASDQLASTTNTYFDVNKEEKIQKEIERVKKFARSMKNESVSSKKRKRGDEIDELAEKLNAMQIDDKEDDITKERPKKKERIETEIDWDACD